MIKKSRHFLFLISGFVLGLIPTFSQDVDLLTGRPTVSFPITSVSNGSISAGISLNYQGDGYRVGDREGTAGIGWSLMGAGGYVSRDVRGLPDDLDIASDARKGWLYGSQAASVTSFTPTADNSCTDWPAVNSLVINKDSEPDIFYVSAPGLNCSFVFDQNKNIQWLQQQNTKITYTRDANQNINAFTITTDQGVRYDFSSLSPYLVTRQALVYKQASVTHFTRNYNYYSNPLSFVPFWNLNQITGTSGEVISFA